MLQPTKDKVYVSWEEVMQFCEKVCERFKGVAGVYGIPRGGVIFAVIISNLLDIPMLAAPCSGCLVVDDIADTGETLIHYEERGYRIATMFYNKLSQIRPEYYFKEKNDLWIVYPWEVQNESNRNI